MVFIGAVSVGVVSTISSSSDDIILLLFFMCGCLWVAS